MNYFTLIDTYGETVGILETTLDYETVDLEWSMFNTAEIEGSNDYYIEEFIQLMEEAYPDYYFSRLIIDAIIDALPIESLKGDSKINLSSLSK